MLELLAHLTLNKNAAKPGENLQATITLQNVSDQEIILKYASGKIYDLFLCKEEEEIWRWSKGKYFTMALIKRELSAGEKLAYKVKVPLPSELKVGKYYLSGEITAEQHIHLPKIEIIVEGK